MHKDILGAHKFWQKASPQHVYSPQHIYKGENSGWVGQSVMEVVNSVPLEEPGFCPRGQDRDVTERDLANNKHQFVVATHQSGGQPRAESLWWLCPGPWTGTAGFTFSVWKSCEEESVACCLPALAHQLAMIVTCFTFFLFCSSSSNSITNNLIDLFTQIFSQIWNLCLIPTSMNCSKYYKPGNKGFDFQFTCWNVSLVLVS